MSHLNRSTGSAPSEVSLLSYLTGPFRRSSLLGSITVFDLNGISPTSSELFHWNNSSEQFWRSSRSFWKFDCPVIGNIQSIRLFVDHKQLHNVESTRAHAEALCKPLLEPTPFGNRSSDTSANSSNSSKIIRFFLQNFKFRMMPFPIGGIS